MNSVGKEVVIGALVVLLAGLAGCAGPISIALDGRPQAVVVVARDATEPEKHAAAELASFLQQVTGAEFDVMDHYDGHRPRLLVGAGAAKLADPSFSMVGIGKEGMVLRTVGRDVILAGGRPRGTLYAVYTFLEDQTGCRWWAPDVETIPQKRTLEIEPLNRTTVPVFEYRDPLWGQAQGDWLVRNKCNGPRAGDGWDPGPPPRSRGGRVLTVGGAHSFHYFIPPAKYFDKHPEWFSEIEGVRKKEGTQLCLTNEPMTQEFIKNVKAAVQSRYPEIVGSSVYVTQMDWAGHCECDPCTEINDREESLAGTNIHFANKVGDALAKEFPGVAVRTLAYDWSQDPPKFARVSPNVIVQLCSTDVSYLHPYTDDTNKQFAQRLAGWSRIANRIYVWDYLVNFGHYLAPFPNLRTLEPNARLFADSSVQGIMAQGAWESDGHGGVALGGEMAELRCWVLAKLFWDPSLDADALIDEFLAGYYGSAGRHVRAYLDVIHDAAQETGETMGMLAPPTAEFLSLEVLSEGYHHLQRAEAAADDDDVRLRVQVAQMGLLYTFLIRWDELWLTAKRQGAVWPLEDTLDDAYARFMDIKRRGPVTRLSEQDARDWFQATVTPRLGRTQTPPPPGCENLPPKQWADLNDSGLRLNHSAAKPRIVDDPEASDGKAALLDENPANWIDYPVGKLPVVATCPTKMFHVKAAVKFDMTDQAETAFVYGMASSVVKEEQAMKFNAAGIPSGEFQTIDLGVHKIVGGWYNLWFKSAGDPDNVRSVLIDRIWLIQALDVQ